MLKIVILGALLLATCSPQASPPEQIAASLPAVSPTPDEVNEDVLADAPIRPPVFTDEIDRYTRKAGIQRLREVQLAAENIEVRVWMGFGLTALRGFVLNRKGGKWSGYHLFESYESGHSRYEKIPLREPEIGWGNAWDALLQRQILTLPDARSIHCDALMEDGFSYVVEAKKGSNYRTYSYSNPMYGFDNRCSQADTMLGIADLIETNYGVNGFRVKGDF